MKLAQEIANRGEPWVKYHPSSVTAAEALAMARWILSHTPASAPSAEVAEIRQRHLDEEKYRQSLKGNWPPAQSHKDRATLLREIEHLQAGEMRWRPIESAPKDGTRILLRRNHRDIHRRPIPDRIGRWDEQLNQFLDDQDYGMGGECWYASWMPLPAPPSPAPQEK